jgi:hypothetical protein
MKGIGTEANHITALGPILIRPESPALSLTYRVTITEHHRGMRGYPMDILEIIGEDGNGKDIGKGMKDGGKADTEGTMTDVADQHLTEGTVETAALTAGNCCCKSQLQAA